jgi:hypothetical protein
VDDRPPFSVAAPASDRETTPNEEQLQAVAASVSFAVAPYHQHLAFRRETQDGWTVVHLLPQGVPFRSDHSDVDGDEPLPWSDFPSPQALALEAIERGRPDLTLAAVRDQAAAQPWNDALLDGWPGEKTIHETLLERLRDHPPADEDFVDRAGTKALVEVRQDGKKIRWAVDLLLALGDAGQIADMDERLLGALPDPKARSILARRVARIPTLGRDHPPNDDLKARARVALDALSQERK